MDHDLSRLRAIFDEVIQAPPEARAELLVARCEGDESLRRRVEALIATAEADEPFLSKPTRDKPDVATSASSTPTTQTHAGREQPGARIGRYKLLERLGEGGFGEVWVAEQREPVSRKVALKIIKPGMDTRQVIARFEAERQALAIMDHPNIAKVFDGGTTDAGRPYFVMELVKGTPITEYCDAHQLSPKQRLDLFITVCQAVQHAHQKGVIHRDIKPSNVLVSHHDDHPVPKVIDFGIAKAVGGRLTDKSVFTEMRALLGTPAYMSPEQAGMSDLDIDTRSDIYSLGVLLYELLTGTTPFDTRGLMEAGLAEIQRIIREVEPPMPSQRLSTLKDTLPSVAQCRSTELPALGRLLRGDLDWIVMKCLEKDRSRRYDTAAGLAQDVTRHLTGEPVIAAPPSAGYRLRKFVRKHRGAVVSGGLVAAALSLGIAGTTWQWWRANAVNVELNHQNGIVRDQANTTALLSLKIFSGWFR